MHCKTSNEKRTKRCGDSTFLISNVLTGTTCDKTINRVIPPRNQNYQTNLAKTKMKILKTKNLETKRKVEKQKKENRKTERFF